MAADARAPPRGHVAASWLPLSQRCAPPHSIRRPPGTRAQRRRTEWQTGATAARSPAKKPRGLVAQAAPRRRRPRRDRARLRRARGELRAAPRRTAAPRAGQAQPQPAAVPGARRDRQRPAGPFVQPAQRTGLVELERERRLGGRPRQHLERHLGDQPRCRASRTAGATRRSRRRSSSPGRRSAAARPVPSSSAGAEHEVAHRAGRSRGAARTGRGDQPPMRGAAAETRAARRRSIWPLLGQRRFDFGQRRAAARGDHQFGRLVVDDAAPARACRAPRPASGWP